MTTRRARATSVCRAAVVAATLITGCAATPRVATGPANPLREQLEQRLGALPSEGTLQLRYNPAPCDCPALELALEGQWLRADLVARSSNSDLGLALVWLADQAPERWPLAVQVRGGVERDVLRTSAGAYAVRVSVGAITGPAELLRALRQPPPPPSDAAAPGPGAGESAD